MCLIINDIHIFEKILEVEIIRFLPYEMEKVPLFSKENLLNIIITCDF